MGWLLVFVVVGSVAAAVLCLVCRKRRSSARLNSEDNWQAQWSQVSRRRQTTAGGAGEISVRWVCGPMADDREKGFSDDEPGRVGVCGVTSYLWLASVLRPRFADISFSSRSD